jgi:hypothetical protein
MAKVFISYRRADSASVVGRIYERLVTRYGRSNVFKDTDSIPAGSNFRDHIQTVLRRCVLQVVVIGPNWLGTTGAEGRRRLDDPEDLVRVEIETAHQLGLTTIPVLLAGAQMPSPTDLPPSLAFLSDLNALPVRNDPDFVTDTSRLSREIDRAFATRTVSGDGGIIDLFRWRLWILRRQLAVGALALLLLTSFGVLVANSQRTVDPAVVVKTASALSTRAAATQASLDAQATLTAIPLATETAIAGATQTAVAKIVHYPYQSVSPGPGCDQGNAVWRLSDPSQAQDVSCFADHTHVAVPCCGGFAAMSFDSPLPQNYTVSIQVTSPGTTIVNLLTDNHQYLLYPDHYSVNQGAQSIIAGPYGGTGTHTLAVTLQNGTDTWKLDGHVLGSDAQQRTSGPDAIQLAVVPDGGDARVDLTNFTVG